MPTIDQLAPATAASDSDELLVSQSGIARKITRTQILAGLQPQLAVGAGTLLGRNSPGTGGPEQIAVGANLSLNNGVLAASGAAFDIASLPAGTVPASGDAVAIRSRRQQCRSDLWPIHEWPFRHLQRRCVPASGHSNRREVGNQAQ